jgi:hypothetical protein
MYSGLVVSTHPAAPLAFEPADHLLAPPLSRDTSRAGSWFVRQLNLVHLLQAGHYGPSPYMILCCVGLRPPRNWLNLPRLHRTTGKGVSSRSSSERLEIGVSVGSSNTAKIYNPASYCNANGEYVVKRGRWLIQNESSVWAVKGLLSRKPPRYQLPLSSVELHPVAPDCSSRDSKLKGYHASGHTVHLLQQAAKNATISGLYCFACKSSQDRIGKLVNDFLSFQCRLTVRGNTRSRTLLVELKR